MTSLLAVSLGPVQEFIAAARRAADLQAGSSLLVDAAKAAAQAIEDTGARLIFPADTQVDGPNKILAEIEGAPQAAATAAEAAARRFLADAWAAARQALEAALPGALDWELAAGQVEGFLEFSAAWWPLDRPYIEARSEVERLLAGRKALRGFAPAPADEGRPKSPLDPARDSVLRTTAGFQVPEAARGAPLWLKPRETLDALSLLKRLRGSPGAPSTSEMAARAILPALEKAAPEPLRRLRELAARSHGQLDLGDLFFAERLDEEELQRLGLDGASIDRLRRQCLAAGRIAAVPSYYAVLAADGDRIGRLIAAQPDATAHRALSRALAGFTQDARRLVEGRGGHLVYAGGDDVLALLPLNEAVGAGLGLMEAFRARLGSEATLSVGIALAHHLEPLDMALQHARAAEQAAKRRRDSLAVAYHPRGGGALLVSLPRSEAAAEWERWTAAFRNGLARGVPYELRELAREWRGSHLPATRFRAEAKRVFGRKEGGEGLAAPAWVEDAGDLERFSRLLAVARFLSRGEVER